MKTLFLDIGGVLLTNGWGRNSRQLAAEQFKLDYAEMDERHHLSFDTYEQGKMTLDEYLSRIVFYEPRSFLPEDFKQFMYSRSQPYPDMLALVRRLKARHGLKIAVVSNEGRELTSYRINTFGLGDFVDFFIVSSFVHFRKPDKDIYQLALDIAHIPPELVAYVDDRLLFVQEASQEGLLSIHHQGYESTRAELAKLGLTDD